MMLEIESEFERMRKVAVVVSKSGTFSAENWRG
jgi:hypothetical protein